MEVMLLRSIVVSFACLGVLTWVWRLFNWLWLRPKTLEKCLRQQGLSGNPYRLLFGDTKDSSKMRVKATSKPISFSNDYSPRVLPFLHHTIDMYSTNSFIWHGPVPMINITEPEMIREVLSRIDDFPKPINNPFVSMLATGIVAYEGEKWAKQRKLLNPAFHMEKLKLMLPQFYTSCNDMINKWEKMASKTGSCELDVWPFLTTLTADVISRAAFSSSYEEGRRIFQLIREQMRLVVMVNESVYIPGWRYVPTSMNKRIQEIEGEMQVLLQDMIFKKKKEMEAEEDAKDDLLGILMESCFKEVEEKKHGKQKQQQVAMTLKEVINECKLFYLAGQETTSVLLVWTMIMLSKHQDWQALAREEVLRTFGNNTPDFDGLNHLKTVTMILNEVLRLYPPIVELRRRTCSNVKLGKLSLPAGVLVSLPIVLPHQDPRFWGEDAKEFNPERFSEGILKAAKGSNSFFPFSWGPRICLGQNFAIIEAKLALTMILQRFSVKLSPAYVHAPFPAGMLQPQFGAHLIFDRLLR
ncbi:hypothetical protein Ancab_040165 [Ancistrocladus abbreviatus]